MELAGARIEAVRAPCQRDGADARRHHDQAHERAVVVDDELAAHAGPAVVPQKHGCKRRAGQAEQRDGCAEEPGPGTRLHERARQQQEAGAAEQHELGRDQRPLDRGRVDGCEGDHRAASLAARVSPITDSSTRSVTNAG